MFPSHMSKFIIMNAISYPSIRWGISTDATTTVIDCSRTYYYWCCVSPQKCYALNNVFNSIAPYILLLWSYETKIIKMSLVNSDWRNVMLKRGGVTMQSGVLRYFYNKYKSFTMPFNITLFSVLPLLTHILIHISFFSREILWLVFRNCWSDKCQYYEKVHVRNVHTYASLFSASVQAVARDCNNGGLV